ncbi:MAG: hypothetical protein HRU18_03015 [Pseudoalteromonas sp.]|uniref:hypothetical protein n=1 Tax=Pseudoalteromonas sp. TaxID=53249 RepID=UPI001E0101FD|nr:hypothetical protein [Pseudoalteromonas sp.]NRA77155.1 hypothetical protein [Pseudoalteromonas sp.]
MEIYAGLITAFCLFLIVTVFKLAKRAMNIEAFSRHLFKEAESAIMSCKELSNLQDEEVALLEQLVKKLEAEVKDVEQRSTSSTTSDQ